MATKITDARRAMLEQLDREPGYYASYYSPLRWAVAQGYASEIKNDGWFKITDNGRRALAEDTKARAKP